MRHCSWYGISSGSSSFAILTHIQAKLRKRDESDPDMTLDSRQLPSFGAYWEHWNFQGASFYHRANIDGKGYYIGNDVSVACKQVAFYSALIMVCYSVERPHLQHSQLRL